MRRKPSRKWYWGRREENVLLWMTGECGDRQIARRLGRTVQAVRHKRHRLARGK